MTDAWMVEVFCAELGEYELLSGFACLTREQARDEITEARKKSAGLGLKFRAVRYRRVEEKTKEDTCST